MFLAGLLFVGLSLRAEAATATTNAGPAATSVSPSDTDAHVNLLPAETIQLTDCVTESLANSNNADVRQYAHLFAFGADVNSYSPTKARRSKACKTIPGDPSWPSKIVWGVFDLLLGGVLSPIVPIGSSCYQSPNSSFGTYDATQCANVEANWNTPSLHYNDPGSVMWPIYEGKSCVPPNQFLALSTCTQGGYSAYSVNVSNVAQIQLAVNFARAANLRLVAKNTGHDYNGRSTGKGALSLWTQHLKDVRYVKAYNQDGYSGPAFKVGAGIMDEELYAIAEKYGVSVVGGICPTVGLAGGYVQGGGHSPLMPLFGMGADSVLALEVVTASGRFVTASPSVNPDLYWAMLGGGGNTFGVVTSIIVKAHPKVGVTTSTWAFGNATLPEETFWKAFAALWSSFPAWNDAKTYSYFFLTKSAGYPTLTMSPFFAPNMSQPAFEALLAPFFANLTALGIQCKTNTAYYDSFYPAYEAAFATLNQNVGNGKSVPGNWIVQKENWKNGTIIDATIDAVKSSVSSGFQLNIYHQAPAAQDNIMNSVNPAFRNEAGYIVFLSNSASSNDQLGRKAKELSDNMIEPLREVSPNGGAYLNEAAVVEPNWQQAFWGANYPKLLSIKKKWDPTGLFYVHHGVGTEDWTIKDGVKFGGIPTQDGQLCPVS